MVLSHEQQHAGSHDAEIGFLPFFDCEFSYIMTEDMPSATALRAKYVPAALVRKPIQMRKFKRSDLEVFFAFPDVF